MSWKRQIVFGFALASLFSTICCAQTSQSFPAMDGEVVHSRTGPAAEQSYASTNQPTNLAAAISPVRDNPVISAHRSLGKAFWISWAVLFAEVIADNELTVNCVQSSGCNEANPIFGTKPGRLKLYGIKMPLFAAILYLDGKEKLAGRRDWKLPSYVLIPEYGAVVLLNAHLVSQAHSPLVANTPAHEVEIVSSMRSR